MVMELYSHDISRMVMEDKNRPCLFGVRGPCFHPKCLEAHYQTFRQQALKEAGDGDGVGV